MATSKITVRFPRRSLIDRLMPRDGVRLLGFTITRGEVVTDFCPYCGLGDRSPETHLDGGRCHPPERPKARFYKWSEIKRQKGAP